MQALYTYEKKWGIIIPQGGVASDAQTPLL